MGDYLELTHHVEKSTRLNSSTQSHTVHISHEFAPRISRDLKSHQLLRVVISLDHKYLATSL